MPVNQEKPANKELPVNQEKPVSEEKAFTKKNGLLRKGVAQIEDQPKKNEVLKQVSQPKKPCVFCFKELYPKSMKEHTTS